MGNNATSRLQAAAKIASVKIVLKILIQLLKPLRKNVLKSMKKFWRDRMSACSYIVHMMPEWQSKILERIQLNTRKSQKFSDIDEEGQETEPRRKRKLVEEK